MNKVRDGLNCLIDPDAIKYEIDGKLYYTYDKKHYEPVSPRFREIKPFSEGFAPVRIDRKWGYIDLNGSVVIPAQYAGCYSLKNGFAVVYHSNPRGNKLHSCQLIDSSGNALTPWVDYFGDYVSEEGLRRIQISDLWGFSDLFGNIIIKPQYKFALDFIGGLAPVEVENKGWGFIDSSGKFHTPPAHTLAELSVLQTDKAKRIPPENPEHSYNIICENGKAGIADSENNIIIAPMFEEVKLLHPNIIGAKWCDFWDIIIL